MTRSLNIIAEEIIDDWRPSPNFAADPYINAMLDLKTIDQKYYAYSASSIVRYFLANAGTWRGEIARRIKTELKEMLAAHDKAR